MFALGPILDGAVGFCRRCSNIFMSACALAALDKEMLAPMVKIVKAIFIVINLQAPQHIPIQAKIHSDTSSAAF